MTTVASFAFKCIESHTDTNDIVDLIANKFHRLCFNDGIKDDIEKRQSFFEKTFFENEGNRLDVLFEKYPEMDIYIDEYHYWTTIVFHLTETRFIMCHKYMEMYDSHYILVEGDISSTNDIDIERFYYNNFHSNYSTNSLKEYIALAHGFNHIPFHYLCDMINPDVSHHICDMINPNLPYKYTEGIKQTSVRKWFNPEEICNSLTDIMTIEMIKMELMQLE